MLLIAFIALVIWIAVSVSAGLLLGRMATLNGNDDLPREKSAGSRPRAIPVLRIARDRAA